MGSRFRTDPQLLGVRGALEDGPEEEAQEEGLQVIG